MDKSGFAIIPMDEYMRVSAQAKKGETQVAVIKDRTIKMIKSLSKDTRQLLFDELESAGYSKFVRMIRKMIGE